MKKKGDKTFHVRISIAFMYLFVKLINYVHLLIFWN